MKKNPSKGVIQTLMSTFQNNAAPEENKELQSVNISSPSNKSVSNKNMDDLKSEPSPDLLNGFNPQDEIVATTVPRYTDNKWTYLDEDILQKDFDFCLHSTGNTTFKINWCAYIIDKCYIEGAPPVKNDNAILDKEYAYNHFVPFVKYIFEKDETCRFPTMDYECPVISSSEHTTIGEDDDRSPEQVDFENECMKFVLSLLKSDETIHKNHIDLKTIYRGFMQIDTTNQIYAFFDLTSLIKDILLKETWKYGIIDEIIFTKKIQDSPIDETITDLFMKTRHLKQIFNDMESPYPTPYCFYMNVFDKENMGEMKTLEVSNVTDQHMYFEKEHPLYGPTFLFSDKTIDNNADKCQRFACFLVNVFSIDDKLEDMDEDELNKLKTHIVNASTVEYMTNEMNMWSIKNRTHVTEI